ncbi:MAG: hypothetical protein H6766_03200 [Candidatus Peribacteria bacterium]|nr:MAG: hypothetical protein H6766_03200 [Candidatus Peribacteria bacterium]
MAQDAFVGTSTRDVVAEAVLDLVPISSDIRRRQRLTDFACDSLAIDALLDSFLFEF